jgi:hypothetical protein
MLIQQQAEVRVIECTGPGEGVWSGIGRTLDWRGAIQGIHVDLSRAAVALTAQLPSRGPPASPGTLPHHRRPADDL